MGDQDHTYYNATILCQKTDPTSNDYQAMFEDNLSQNIITRIGDYQMAIARYSMEGQNLPIFIPSIQDDETNLTTYSVQLNVVVGADTYVSGEVFLNYVPQNTKLTPSDTEYYFMYNYDNFVDMMNNALKTAWTQLQANAAGSSYTLLTSVPILTYDGSANLFNMYCDEKGFVTKTEDEAMQIIFNNDLYTLLKTFYFTTLAGNYRSLNVPNKITNVATQGGINYFVATQTAPSTSSCWSPVQSLIFSSDSVSLKPEIIGRVSKVGANLALGADQSKDDQSMITDIILDLNRSSDYFSEMVSYVPSMYRWVDMSDGSNLRYFRFSVFWLNKYDRLRYPVYLSNNGIITLKILFQKKYI